jgi:cobalt-zinc-cadmium efflux system membrane fusion protein
MSILLVAAAACQRTTSTEKAGVEVPADEVWVTQKQIRDADITTDVVAEHPIGDALVTTGRITFSDTHVAHIFSPVTGRVTRILANLGQPVARGTPVAAIESPDLATAVSDLQKSEADLAAAERDFERQKELLQGHAAAERDYDAAQSNYRKAKAERDRAAQKCSLLRVDGATSTQGYVLRSPIAGDVVARNASPGMEIQGQYSGGNATELFTIADLRRVWVMADVFEMDIARLRLGAPVTVNVVAYPDRQFTGNVDWISGALDPTTRAAKVRCVIDNAEGRLRPEMYATASISTGERSKLAIPRTAVVRLGEQMMTFVDRGATPDGGKRFQRREVAIDDTQAGQFVPVLRGLQPGERIVSSGALILSGAGS